MRRFAYEFALEPRSKPEWTIGGAGNARYFGYGSSVEEALRSVDPAAFKVRRIACLGFDEPAVRHPELQQQDAECELAKRDPRFSAWFEGDSFDRGVAF